MIIRFKSSKTMIIMQFVFYIIGIYAISVLNFNLWLKLVFIAVITAMLILFWLRSYLKIANHSILSLSVKNHQYQIELKNGQIYLVKPLPSTMVSRFFIALDLKVVGLKKVYRLFVLRDNVVSEAHFRQLARQLKE